jgi:hypothetical protein
MPSTLSPQDFMKLAEAETNELLCSLYFPLDSSGVDLTSKRLQLKNAINRLRSALSAKSFEAEKSSKLISSLESLDSHAHFLDPASQGLAVLVPAGRPQAMRVLALSFRPEESLTLGERYAMAPLLRLFGSSQPRTVLAVADGGLRMLRGTAHFLDPVALPDSFPKNRHEITQFDEASGMDRHHSTQRRIGGGDRKASGGAVEGGMAYHGEGQKETVELEHTRRYFRAIGEAMAGVLSEHETILLAGVHEQLSAFRRANPELPLLDREMAGNFEPISTETFIEQALHVLQDVERQENQGAVSQTMELAKSWWTTSLGPAEKAAREGRVKQLFVNESSLDLPRLEDLVLEVLRHAGTVRTVPTELLHGPCLARFRWSDAPDF